jgi:hypothetical protein
LTATKQDRHFANLFQNFRRLMLSVDQLQIGLVHPVSRLQGVIWPFSRHLNAGKAMQFVINEPHEFFGSSLLAPAPRPELLRDFVLSRFGHDGRPHAANAQSFCDSY